MMEREGPRWSLRGGLTVSLWLGVFGCAHERGESNRRDAGRARDASLDGAGGGSAGDAMAGVDAAGCRPFVRSPACTPVAGDLTLPNDLRCTGLYSDISRREVACGALSYAPSHGLWTDAAVKNRWVSLPPGATIDVTKPDAFVFPVGTQFWKEFNLQDGRGGTRLGETRLIRKVEAGWVYGTYVWNEEATSATQVIDGVQDLFGLGYNVPTRDQCDECHKGRTDFVLGWDLVMLGAGSSGVNLDTLLAMGALSSMGGPVPRPTIPGTTVEQAALGYLHANCGVSCHNRNTAATARLSGLFLRLDAHTLGGVQMTDAVVSGINKAPDTNVAAPFDVPPAAGPFYDFRPRDLDRSLSLARMQVRGPGQMPKIGSLVRDAAGEAAVSAWIANMTVVSGYPPEAP